jgi:serine/threonine protein kinase
VVRCQVAWQNVANLVKILQGVLLLKFYVVWNTCMGEISFIEISKAQTVLFINLVLITAEGGVKISDFGISKKNEYTAYHRMTRMSMQGSIYWMAPEVARGKGYSAKVDIWSCGCLVLEMLTGHVPWHRVQGNIIYLLGTGNSPPIPPELSEMATNFLKTTFEIDPEKRPMASDLLEHTFTDIDPSAVDFRVWSLEAIQRKLEEGTTSEEMTASEPEETSDSDFDEEDEDYEEYEQEMYEEDVSNAPMDQENVLEVNFSDMQLPMLDLDMDDDLYELTGLVPDEESESLEYLLNGSK